VIFFGQELVDAGFVKRPNAQMLKSSMTGLALKIMAYCRYFTPRFLMLLILGFRVTLCKYEWWEFLLEINFQV
jgi:hypothetical protein